VRSRHQDAAATPLARGRYPNLVMVAINLSYHQEEGEEANYSPEAERRGIGRTRTSAGQ